MEFKVRLIFLSALLASAAGFAQSNDSTFVKKNKFTAFPIVFYTPETRLAFGAYGAYTFRSKKDSLQKYPSQIQVGLAYTLNKQALLYVPFRLYTPKDKLVLYGEMGYYIYSYYFYGIGNNQPADYKELYKVNYPRVRLNILTKIKPSLLAGIRYWVEDYRVKELEPGKQLATDNRITGRNGSFTSGIGPVINYDTRDNVIAASKGFFADVAVQLYGTATGSDYTYTRYTADVSTYVANHHNNVWAFNVFADFISGEAPFSQLALLGGNKKMRGYYEGRYRDNSLLAFAAEYRFKLYKKLGGVAFANAGAVGHNMGEIYNLSNIRTSFGGGLRYAINKAERLNIRLDYGIGQGSSGIYFTVGEAF